MTAARTVVQSAAQRAAFLPAPEPGIVITVPLDVLAEYLQLHPLAAWKFVDGVMIYKRVKREGEPCTT